MQRYTLINGIALISHPEDGFVVASGGGGATCIQTRTRLTDPMLSQTPWKIQHKIRRWSSCVALISHPNEGFVIELPVATESRLSVNLIDQLGRAVYELNFEKGDQRKSMDSKNLSEGIYIVQIGSGRSGVVRKKVLVVHK